MQEIAWIIGLTSATSSTTLAHVVQYTATPGHAVWVYCQHILRPIYGDTTSEPTTACHAPPRHSICMISPLPRAPPVTCEAKELTPLRHPTGAGAEKIVWVRRHVHHFHQQSPFRLHSTSDRCPARCLWRPFCCCFLHLDLSLWFMEGSSLDSELVFYQIKFDV